jgi:hypothetical protein
MRGFVLMASMDWDKQNWRNKFERERRNAPARMPKRLRPPAPPCAEVDEAFEFARSYVGDHPFMVEMRREARLGRSLWNGTQRKVAAILRCKRYEERQAERQAREDDLRQEQDAHESGTAA